MTLQQGLFFSLEAEAATMSTEIGFWRDDSLLESPFFKKKNQSLKTPITFKIPQEKKPLNFTVTPVLTQLSSSLGKTQLQRRSRLGEGFCHLALSHQVFMWGRKMSQPHGRGITSQIFFVYDIYWSPYIPSWIWTKIQQHLSSPLLHPKLTASPKSHLSPPWSDARPNRRQEIILPKLFTMAGAAKSRREESREGKKGKTQTTSLSLDFLSKSHQTVQSGAESGFSQLNLTSDAPESFMSIQKF